MGISFSQSDPIFHFSGGTASLFAKAEEAMALKRIFEPITINKVEIPNRIVRTAHGTHLAHEVFTDEAIAYHVERAKGGCGLSVIEASGVHPSSQNTLFNKSDAVIP